MLKSANGLKIGFVGDDWMRKISAACSFVLPQAEITFFPASTEAEAMKEKLSASDATVGTIGTDAQLDVQCPQFYIDGLATIEMSGAGGARRFLGEEPLLALIDQEKDMKIITSALKGNIEFSCAERLDASFAAMVNQENDAIKITDFLKSEFRSSAILTGCKKPTPKVTVEMARRVLIALSIDEASFNVLDHAAVGSLATMYSRRCVMPYDADKLKLTYQTDPFWFPNFGGLFKDLAADFRKRQSGPVPL